MTLSPFHIGILAYDGAQRAAVHGLADLFTVANGRAESRLGKAAPRIRLHHFGEEAGGIVMQPGETEAAPVRLNALILPSSLEDVSDGSGREARHAWIRARHGEGTVIASVCSGAFVLAQTGLLAGRRVTTHWASRNRMEKLYPDIQVDSDKLLIDSGDIMTAGGLMAWTDLGLHLVEKALGHAIMLDTARFLLIDPPGREQRTYQSFQPQLLHGDEPVLRVQHWLQQAFASPASVSAMAAKAGLEDRTFLRRFTRATGLKPNDYLQQVRVSEARLLLEATRMPVEQIAHAVGYEDANAFRKLFIRTTGLKPGEYRQRFGRHATA